MAYNLQLTNGSLLTQLPDGVVDTTTTSLALIGKNFPNWGIHVNQNVLRITENFSNSTSPLNPLQGQLWWDSNNKLLKVHRGAGLWKVVSTGRTGEGNLPPSSPDEGDFWWNPVTKQLNAWNATAGNWRTIGPVESIAVPPTNFTGNVIGSDIIGNVTVANKLVGVFATGDTVPFTTSQLIGINKVNPGLNFAGSVEPTLISSPNMEFGVNAGSVHVTSITGGTGIALRVSPTGAGSTTTALSVDGSTARVSVSQAPVGNLDVVNKGHLDSELVDLENTLSNSISSLADTISSDYATVVYVDEKVGNITLSNLSGTELVSANLVPAANLLYNLGNTSLWWNNIYGTSVHARYADLAERFSADAEYQPGTVVELGGEQEVTIALHELSDDVFGVVSTDPAYLMNSSSGDNITHPPIALQGRVPVLVTGPVSKGDRLVAAGSGLARKGQRHELTPWNVIGRAIEDKEDVAVGLVLVAVRIN